MRAKPKPKADKKQKQFTIEKIYFLKANNYFLMLLKKQKFSLKSFQETGIKILTPEQMLQTFLIELVRVKQTNYLLCIKQKKFNF